MKTRRSRRQQFVPYSFDSELGIPFRGVKTVSWVDDWTETDRIRARIDRKSGTVIAFCVQYEFLVHDRWLPVMRIDASPRERPHLHVFEASGSARKEPLVDGSWSLAGAFHEALASIQETFEKQKERFIDLL